MARSTFAASCVLLCTLVGLVSCQATPLPSSQAGLMVVVSTNLTAPEYDEIRVQVSQQQASGPFQSWLDVSKQVPSETTLPTTVFIEAGHSADQEVDVRVTAYLSGTPIVLREAQLQAPTDRVATLYFVLAEVCKGQVRVTGAEGEPESTCPISGQSCQPGTGTCGPSNLIVTSTLPTFVPGQSLDAGGDAGLFAGAPAEGDAGDAGSSGPEAAALEASADSSVTIDATMNETGADGGGPDSSPSDGAADVPECTDACTEGLTTCEAGAVQTCERPPGRCAQWTTTTTCGAHQNCTTTGPAAACACLVDPVCTSANPTCVSPSTLATCLSDVENGQTCFYASPSTTTCTNGACSAGACCTNACSAAACLPTSSTSIQSCGPGGNGCTVATTSACGTGLVCERSGGAACVSPLWAEWPMPNSQVDVTAGAPNLESYTDNGDGTVTDNVTALVWQQATPSTTYTQANAVSYCAGLNLAGFTDWRLPSIIELVSLVDTGMYGPSINNTHFPLTPSSPTWSATPVSGASTGWAVNFEYGNPFFNATSVASVARCVR